MVLHREIPHAISSCGTPQALLNREALWLILTRI